MARGAEPVGLSETAHVDALAGGDDCLELMTLLYEIRKDLSRGNLQRLRGPEDGNRRGGLHDDVA